MKLPAMTEKNAEKVWKTMAWATYDGDVPVIMPLEIDPEVATATW